MRLTPAVTRVCMNCSATVWLMRNLAGAVASTRGNDRSSWSGSVQYQDRLGFDPETLRQARDADGGARRIGRREILGHDPVHRRRVRQIGEVDGQLDHLRQGAAAGLCHRAEVGEYLMDLILDAGVMRLLSVRVDGYLAGQVHGVAAPDRLAVSADRGWCQVRMDQDRKSTRLNSSHMSISYAVFCLK